MSFSTVKRSGAPEGRSRSLVPRVIDKKSRRLVVVPKNP